MSIGARLAALAACALAVTAAPAAAQTCPHPGTIKGVSVLIWCGHAKATVKVGASTVTYENGMCRALAGNFYVDFGATVTELTKHAPDSFQLVAGSSAKPVNHDGTFPGTTVQMTRSGKSYLADALTLTVTHNRKAGTATGKISPIGGKAVAFHATFSC